MIERYDLIVIGAGPAGLSAAIEAAKNGMKPIVFDENAKPGGQLFKQIHKFFGSKEHKAKIRGFNIGYELLEEASSAMIEGRIAGSVISQDLGFIEKTEMEARASELEDALGSLREGMFAPKNRGKLIEKTEEGIDVSMNLLEHGFVADDEIERYPGVTHRKGIHPVIECTQNIPCNPCQDACPKGCISIGANITSLPTVTENPCIGCGMCVASCSGQAIFLVDEDTGDGYGTVTLPYEFLPIPEKGTKGVALGRDGHEVCEAEVVSVRSAKAFDHTNLLTMKVPKDMVMKARFFKEVRL